VKRSGLWPYLWMLAGCFSFAWMAKFSSILTTHGHDWRLVALVRSFLMLIFALLITTTAGARLAIFGPRALWVRSLAGSASVICNFYAIYALGPPEALALSNTFPIWVAFLSWPLLGQKPTLAIWCGALCGVAGVALIQWPHLQGGGHIENLGVPVALFAALCSATAMLGLNRLAHLSTSAIVAHFSATATLVTVSACLIPPHVIWPAADLVPALLLLLGVAVAALGGQLCLTRAFSTGSPAAVSVVALTQIPIAIILDLLFGKRDFHPLTLVGIALVLAPTAWVITSRAPRTASAQPSARRTSTGRPGPSHAQRANVS
jgi:drug/metabolite transporter (DMT)-like permease